MQFKGMEWKWRETRRLIENLRVKIQSIKAEREGKKEEGAIDRGRYEKRGTDRQRL